MVKDTKSRKTTLSEKLKAKMAGGDGQQKIEDSVAQQSLKLAQQEKEALDKLMNDVKDLVKD